MRKGIQVLIIFLLCLGCTTKDPVRFSEKALNDEFLTIEGTSISFREVLEKYGERKILVNVWASWCGDCREALPEEKKLLEEYPETVFLHLSLDNDVESWKNGIKKLGIEGEHYFMKSGWKGDFGTFLNLNWIPRYLVLDKTGQIEVFNVTKPTSKLIRQNLKK